MATQVVELSGDEANLLRALDRVIAKEREQAVALERMGTSADTAGIALEGALKTVENAAKKTVDETVRQLNKLGPGGKAAAEALQAGLAEAGKGKFATVDNLLQKVASLDPATAEVVGRVKQHLAEADNRAAFDETLAAMRGLGGEAAVVANEIGTRLKQSDVPEGAFDGYLAQLVALNPEAAQVAEQVRANLADADRQSAFDETLRSLRELGPEGRAIADAYSQQMVAAATDAKGGIDGIIERLKAIDPTVEEVATKIRGEIAAADKATKFDDSIRELQKINPEAAAAARKVREHMELADAQVKFDDTIAELAKVDPAAAKAAAAMKGHMKTAANESESTWTTFTDKALGNLKTIAAAYVGKEAISSAIAKVNELIEEQSRLLDHAASKQLELAKSQQEAVKNLAALTTVQQNEMLTSAVGEIASTAKVGDAASITNALGGAISAGATQEEAISAVSAAAMLNRLTPEKIGPTSSAAVDFAKATGRSDARSNIALLTTTGTQARIEDPQILATNLAPALTSAVASVPNQDREEATREGAALFSGLSQAVGDKQGDKSRTATIQITAELDKFFSKLEDQRIDARSKIELIDRKIAKGSDTEANRRDREQLIAFLKQADGMQDSGTIYGRFDQLQQNSAVADQMFSREFGEAEFKAHFRALADPNSNIAKQLKASKEKIRLDSAAFDTLLENTTSLTPQLLGANIVAGVNAAADIRDFTDPESQSLSQVRELTEKTLSRTRVPGLFNLRANMADEVGVRPSFFNPTAGTAAEEGIANIDRLLARRSRIADDGITATEALAVNELDATIRGLRELMTKQELSPESLEAAARRAGARATSATLLMQPERAQYFQELQLQLQERAVTAAEAQVAALNRQNELMEQNNNLLAETADNTAPGPAPMPDYDGINRAALAAEDSR